MKEVRRFVISKYCLDINDSRKEAYTIGLADAR